jgi:hypothetical protein
MSDPILKRSSVTIRYTSSDGYSSQVCYSNIGRMGTRPPPEQPILEAIDELSRLAELFGFGHQATEAQALARKRVMQWRAERTEKGGAA